MKNLTLLTLSLLFIITGYSLGKEHYISLEKETVTILNFGFRLFNVTNATGAKTNIGYVQKSISYNEAPAYFLNDIEIEVKNFLNRNIEENQGDVDLIVRVNKIEISESYNGMSEKAIASVSLSFIYKDQDKYFEKFTVGMSSQNRAAAGVTKSQPGLIANSIAQCFDAFYERYREKKLTNIEMPESELYIKPHHDKDDIEAIMAMDRSVKGIYKTFSDFKMNTPDTDTEFEIDYKIKSSGDESVTIKYAQITDSKNGDKIDEYWGFTDGKAVFTIVGNNYLPLLKDKDGYFLMMKVKDAEAMHSAGIAGGLIGSSIAAAASPTRKVKLNYSTGMFDYSDQDESFKKYSKEYAVCFFSSTYNHPNSRLDLYVNDELKCSLKKETWYEYEMNEPHETLKISIKSTNGFESTKTIIPKTKNQDVFLCIDKKKKEPAINKITSEKVDGIRSLMLPTNRIYDMEKN